MSGGAMAKGLGIAAVGVSAAAGDPVTKGYGDRRRPCAGSRRLIAALTAGDGSGSGHGAA